MRLYWIDVYLDPPDSVPHDAGKRSMAMVLQTNAELLDIDTKCVRIELLNAMTYVERYHAQMRHDYKVVKS